MIVFTLAYIKIAGTMKGSRGHFFPTSRIHDDSCIHVASIDLQSILIPHVCWL